MCMHCLGDCDAVVFLDSRGDQSRKRANDDS